MDLPLRSRLLAVLLFVVFIYGGLCVLAGGFLIKSMVINEAQRRVDLALKTAHAMFEERIQELRRAGEIVAGSQQVEDSLDRGFVDETTLAEMQKKGGFDFLHFLDAGGRLIRPHGRQGAWPGDRVVESPTIRHALESGNAEAGVSLLRRDGLVQPDAMSGGGLQAGTHTGADAGVGGNSGVEEILVLETAAPVRDATGAVSGILHAGTVLNQNFDLVDFVRDNIFTDKSYEGKNLGTVTVFQGDVRITTNVIGPDGRRAVGTRVSREVNNHVLEQGRKWTGPAFVVDSWYLSAYEPLKDTDGKTLGMLYVGVLKKRYDDMRKQAMKLFLVVTFVASLGAVLLSLWLSSRLSRPLARLTSGVAEVSRGNLNFRLTGPPGVQRDEIGKLACALNRMVTTIRDREGQLQSSRDELQKTADQLHRSVNSYLGTLEFITHELKNKIAGMKINLLAVRDGYLGPLPANQKEALDDVAAAIQRSEEMIMNYLNLSRIEKGELQVREGLVHLELDVLRPVLNEFRSRLEARGFEVRLEIEKDLIVRGDPSLLKTVYENLVSNAVKYGRQGGVISIQGSRKGAEAELHVCNDGPGVPGEQIERLFEKFFRNVRGSGTDKGTGLGLFITREIIQRHGGRIRVDGVYEKWIDFIFTLPAGKA